MVAGRGGVGRRGDILFRFFIIFFSSIFTHRLYSDHYVYICIYIHTNIYKYAYKSKDICIYAYKYIRVCIRLRMRWCAKIFINVQDLACISVFSFPLINIIININILSVIVIIIIIVIIVVVVVRFYYELLDAFMPLNIPPILNEVCCCCCICCCCCCCCC